MKAFHCYFLVTPLHRMLHLRRTLEVPFVSVCGLPVFLEESRRNFFLGFCLVGVRWASREFPRPLSLVAALNHQQSPLLHDRQCSPPSPFPPSLCPTVLVPCLLITLQHLSSQIPSSWGRLLPSGALGTEGGKEAEASLCTAGGSHPLAPSHTFSDPLHLTLGKSQTLDIVNTGVTLMKRRKCSFCK